MTDAASAAMRLDEVQPGTIRALTQTELKSVLSSLKDIAKREPAIAEMMAGDSPLKDFVANAFTLSPYLRDAASADEGLLTLAVSEPVEASLGRLVEQARNCWRPGEDGAIPTEAEVMTTLRVAKRRLSFIAALADLGRIFTARDTTRWLSDMADAALSAAIDHLLLANHNSGKLTLKDPQAPSEGSGLIVLGMGKLGARELNYSSDIDAVVFFEPMAGIVPDPLDALEIFGRMMRRLIRIMQERTADGYVFRTDLRLRPDPAPHRSPYRSMRRCFTMRAGGRTGSGRPISRRDLWQAISRRARASCGN